METLLELRKKAQKLGIEDYASYSKEDLCKKIAEMEQNSEATTEAQEEADEKAVKEKIEKGEVQEISAKEAEKLEKDQKLKKSRGAKAKKAETEETEEESPKEETKEPSKAEKAAMKAAEKRKKEAKKAKKTKKVSYIYTYTARSKKPKDLGPTSSKVYDELIQSNESVYKIAKKMGTYFSIVDRIASKYFDVTKQEVSAGESKEA